VEPRKYRFRFLCASVSRSFQLYFEQASKVITRLDFNVVGSNAGLLLNPVQAQQLGISMAERYEVVMDFSLYKNSNVTLRNNRKVAADTDYLHTDKIMQFVVGNTVSDSSKSEDLPIKLRDVQFPPAHAPIEHEYEFQRTNGEWKINGVSWADGSGKRILAKPQRGAIENWSLKNGAGGWSHPVRMHTYPHRRPNIY
jgi:bilirubin oxidase